MHNKSRGMIFGFFIGAIIVLNGLVLQLMIGAIPWTILSFHTGWLLLLGYISFLVFVYSLRNKVNAFKWLGSIEAAIPAIVYTVALTLVMGLTKQTQSAVKDSVLGFESMTSSWIFFIVYLWLTTVVGLVCIERLVHFRTRNIPFLLSHLGLFFLLVFSTLGSACMLRLTMTLRNGDKVNMAMDSDHKVYDLPFAIELNRFTLEEYMPKVLILDLLTGDVVPKEKLAAWNFKVEKQILRAIRIETKNSINYISGNEDGATSAFYIKADNTKTRETKSGWVACESFLFPPEVFPLDNDFCLFMPEREPKRFASSVTVHLSDGKAQKETIEVNSPIKIGGWFIYQLDYDREKGRWSDISVLELVEDRWLPFVYAGVLMMISGAVCMFFTSNINKRRV